MQRKNLRDSGTRILNTTRIKAQLLATFLSVPPLRPI